MVAVSEVILATQAPDGSGMLPAELVRVLTLQLVLSDDTPRLGLPSSGHGDSKRDGWAFWKSLDLPSSSTQPRQEVGEWLSHRGCPQRRP